MNEERSAKGVKGHLLYDHHKEEYFFRVYDQPPVVGQPASWTDYKLAAEAIEIIINDSAIALVDGKLCLSSQYTGKADNFTERRDDRTIMHIKGAVSVLMSDGSSAWFPPAYVAKREGRPFDVQKNTIISPYWTRGEKCEPGKTGPDLTEEEIETIWPK